MMEEFFYRQAYPEDDLSHVACPAYPNCDFVPEQCLFVNHALREDAPPGFRE